MKISTVTLPLLAVASADFQGDEGRVSSLAQSLGSQVDAWSSQAGLLAALNIQNGFGPLVSAVRTLSNDVSGLQGSDVDVGATEGLVSSVTSLLAALTSKANDFNAVGASSIVQGDISSVQAPAAAAVSGIVSALSGDCAKITSLLPALSSLSVAFSSVDAAYSVSQASFPGSASC